MDDKKNAENAKNFNCENCYFSCNKYSEWVRHLSTRKHKMDDKDDVLDDKKTPKNATPYFCNCGKEYKHRQGLWKHQKICKSAELIKINEEQNEIKMLTCLVLDVVKQNKDLASQNSELTNKIFDLCKEKNNTNITNNNINSNNKTFNLNVFLNETCKDAMNIMDFVDSLKLQLSDLESVGKLGYIEGISNIIVKNLKAMDVHKRPVHCSDSKREVVYIKDEDKWEKENDDKKKLRKAIKLIAHKNSKLLPQFKEKYPDCSKCESIYSEHYNKLIIEAMGGLGDNTKEKEDKIIKKITKEVTIDKTF